MQFECTYCPMGGLEALLWAGEFGIRHIRAGLTLEGSCFYLGNYFTPGLTFPRVSSRLLVRVAGMSALIHGCFLSLESTWPTGRQGYGCFLLMGTMALGYAHTYYHQRQATWEKPGPFLISVLFFYPSVAN